MPKPIARATRVEDNDRKVMAAARAVFVRHGYQAASLDRVASAAGLTKGALYARFDSKADLLLALLEARITERIAELAALPPPAGADTVDAVFRQWLDRSRDDVAWSLLVIEFRVVAARDRALNARYAALHDRLVAAIAARIDAARADLALSSDEAARIGLALGTGVLLERAASGDALTEVGARRANTALYTGLLGPARTARRPR